MRPKRSIALRTASPTAASSRTSPTHTRHSVGHSAASDDSSSGVPIVYAGYEIGAATSNATMS